MGPGGGSIIGSGFGRCSSLLHTGSGLAAAVRCSLFQFRNPRLCCGQKFRRRDVGHAVPHDAAELLVQPCVGDLAGGDGGGACRAGDLGKAEVVDQLGAGDGRGRGCAGCRALQHLQAGGSGTGIIAHDDAVDAGERWVGQRQGQGIGLPLCDGVAGETAGVHPATARAHGDLQPACGCHQEVLSGAEHTAGEARKVGRHVCGIEVVAVGGV